MTMQGALYLSLYLDVLFKAVELRGKGHAPNQQGCPHVGEPQHQLLGLPFDLDG